jgi:hypothetical protein
MCGAGSTRPIVVADNFDKLIAFFWLSGYPFSRESLLDWNPDPPAFLCLKKTL